MRGHLRVCKGPGAKQDPIPLSLGLGHQHKNSGERGSSSLNKELLYSPRETENGLNSGGVLSEGAENRQTKDKS